jgi:hypothetical protein
VPPGGGVARPPPLASRSFAFLAFAFRRATNAASSAFAFSSSSFFFASFSFAFFALYLEGREVGW